MRLTRSCWGAQLFSVCALSFGFLLMLSNTRAGAQTGFGMVEIIVLDQTGTRISNVNLCLAMPGQSMRRMTDQNGTYKTTLPVGETTIRLSRSGYANAQNTVTMTNGADFVRQIVLQPGQSTPLPSDCGSVAATATDGNACDVVATVRADGPTTTTNRQVTLLLTFKSPPDSYRITEFSQAERYPEAQFNPDDAFSKKNVPWVRNALSSSSFTTFFTLTEPHYGTHSIYVQTRRYQSGCIGRARVVSVILAPAGYHTYKLEGNALQRFVAEAKLRGYQFSHSFKFQKKDAFWGFCGPNEMLVPKNSLLARRQLPPAAEVVDEIIYADFEVFSGPDLNPFWEFNDVIAAQPDLPFIGPRAFSGGAKPALEFEKYAAVSCPYCTAQGVKNLHRRLEWRRLMWRTPIPHSPLDENVTECKRRTSLEPSLIRLEIRGPAGEDPINALGDLRVLRLRDLRLAPPPRLIIPRGVDKEEGAERNEMVEPTAGPKENP